MAPGGAQRGQVSCHREGAPSQLLPSGMHSPAIQAAWQHPLRSAVRGEGMSRAGAVQAYSQGSADPPWEGLLPRVEGNLASTPTNHPTSMGLATMSLASAKTVTSQAGGLAGLITDSPSQPLSRVKAILMEAKTRHHFKFHKLQTCGSEKEGGRKEKDNI
ncbi:hypothetical protein AOLI_G00135410 [Acnodon oligacanthus]